MVIVCGGRAYDNFSQVVSTLDRFRPIIKKVCHGGATGADSMAARWAKSRGVPCQEYAAEWKTYGRQAGPIRNTKMLQESRASAVIAFPGGAGTKHMVDLATRHGVPVVRVGW